MARAGIAPLPDDRDLSKPSWLGVIRVANIEETLERVLRLGGAVVVSPRPINYESRFAIISDPSGGAVGLVEYSNNANPANRP